MLTILYTDSDGVRSVLGVESFSGTGQRELPDSMFVSSGMERQLRSDLYGWVPTHAAMISAGDDGAATDEQVYQADLIRNYSLYFVANKAAKMAYATRRIVSDGKSEMQRFEIDWLAVADSMAVEAKEAKQLLQDLLSPSVATSFLSLVVPAYDPVTNV